MSVLTLADAKTHLNLSGTTYDVELQAVINSAEAALAKRVGPLAATAVTRRIAGGCYELALPVTPVISLTSVTPRDGTALTLADLYVDPITGMVSYNSGAGFSAAYYTVAYSAGRSTCPDDLLFAVKELVRHLWQPKRGPRSANTASTDETVPGSTHLLPYRIAEMIAHHVQIPAG